MINFSSSYRTNSKHVFKMKSAREKNVGIVRKEMGTKTQTFKDQNASNSKAEVHVLMDDAVVPGPRNRTILAESVELLHHQST